MGKRFEELPVWRDSRVLVRDVYVLTRRAPFSRDAGLCDQLQRAAVSVCSNIAEGHERGTTPDLIQFLFYAKGSAGEVRSQLHHVEDLGYAEPAECERMRQAAEGISRQIASWIKSMQGPDFSAGPKHHKEPDRGIEAFWKKLGMERDASGLYRPRPHSSVS
ncbi:MAG TPA: four helix bundle protein [Kiritimatiellia bacterium]|nr:four helix bundle protein [Kiritimatiellia bacterium]